MTATHAKQPTANTQKMMAAFVASATAVSASFAGASPQTKNMAAQLPAITTQVKLTASSDPIALIKDPLALRLHFPGNPTPNAATNVALAPTATPAAATPLDLVGGLGGVLTGAVGTAWTDGAYLLNTALNIGVGVGWPLLTDGPALLFHPDLLVNFFTSYAIPVIQYSINNGLYGIVSTTAQFLSSLAGLLPAAASPLAANTSKLQTNSAAVTPSISPSVPAPQDVVGGLGNVVSSAVSMVANDVAYAVNLPLAVAVPVVVPLVAGLPYTLAPQALLGLLTTNLPNALRFALTNTVSGIVSQAGQFVASLGGLVPAAAAPLAATSVPKVQTNLVKVSKPTAAAATPNTAAGSKSDKTGSDKKSDQTGSDKSGTDKTGPFKTGLKPGGKHSKSTDSEQTGNGQTDAGSGKPEPERARAATALMAVTDRSTRRARRGRAVTEPAMGTAAPEPTAVAGTTAAASSPVRKPVSRGGFIGGSSDAPMKPSHWPRSPHHFALGAVIMR